MAYKCKRCGKFVAKDATVCKHCGLENPAEEVLVTNTLKNHDVPSKQKNSNSKKWLIFILWVGIVTCLSLPKCNDDITAPAIEGSKVVVLGVWKESEYEPSIWKLIKEDDNYMIVWKGQRYKCTKTVIENSSEYLFHTPNLPNSADGYFTIAKGEVIYVCENFEEGTYQETLILILLSDGNACLYLNDINPKIFEIYSYLVPCK